MIVLARPMPLIARGPVNRGGLLEWWRRRRTEAASQHLADVGGHARGVGQDAAVMDLIDTWPNEAIIAMRGGGVHEGDARP